MKKRADISIRFVIIGLFMTLFFGGRLSCEEQAPAPGIMNDIMLVLDNSGSMKKNDPKFLMRDVVMNFVKNAQPSTRVGIVVFDAEARVALPLTQVTGKEFITGVETSLKKVRYQGKLTNSPAGIERAIYELKNNGRKGAHKSIIFITDGIVDTGDRKKDADRKMWLRNDLAADAVRHGIRIFGIAFTEEADYELIQSLAQRTKGDYFRTLRAEDIQGVFDRINEILTRVETEKRTRGGEIPVASGERAPLPAKQPLPPSSPDIQYIYIGIGSVLVILIGLLVIFQLRRTPPALPEREQREILEEFTPARLVDLSNVLSEYSVEIDKPVVRIGRVEGINDIVIPKPTISKQHARIEYKNKMFHVVDLRSSNGTYLNGKRVGSIHEITETPIKSGDKLRFDQYEFKFVLVKGRNMEPTILRAQSFAEGDAAAEDLVDDNLVTDRVPKPELDAVSSDGADNPTNNIKRAEPDKEPQYCTIHSARKAVRYCAVCGKPYCWTCLTKKGGRFVCVRCVDEVE